jgi:hypothetical protein
MKKIILLSLLFFAYKPTQAQRFFSVVFSKLPQDLQLFPRDENNEAVVSIEGIIEAKDWSYMSVQIFRNNTLVKYQKSNFVYNANGNAPFSFKDLKIKAELALFDFKVYAVKGTDSVLIVHRKKIVAGDVYIISGQSNSTAFFNEKATNEFCRTFGKITGNLNNANNYNPADTLWAYSNQDPYFTGVGTLGFQFQKGITEKNGVPTCVINGGFNFSNLASHVVRTASNPADISNGYGRMIYRIQKAGLQKSVKALIFRQGESEAYGEIGDWEGNFDKYYKNIKTDLPNIKKLYVYQIDIISYPRIYAATIRDYQRRLPEIYPDIRNLATVGTKGFDGLHYTPEGYTQNAQELQRLVERDFYASKDTLGINSPNLRKAFFNTAKTEVTLTFDPDQKVIWNDIFSKNGSNFNLSDYIYLNDFAEVGSAKTDGNRVNLKLKRASNATNISYLPSFVPENTLLFPYTGPYITNQKGMRAFSFFEVGIGQGFAGTTMTSSLAFGPKIQLNWNAIANVDHYLLEKKSAKDTSFTTIILNKNLLTFTDTDIATSTEYQYRIRGINAKAESDFTSTNITTPNPLATPVLAGNPTYFDAIKLTWAAIPNATKYTLERKNGNAFEVIGNLTNQLEFSEKDLLPNTNYIYRIKAENNLLASQYVTFEVKTPALLSTPELTSIATYYNATKINWKPITGTIYYILERQSLGETTFKLVEKLSPTTTEYLDKSLKDNTLYTYRLKAYGNLTESLFTLSNIKTPAILATPQVTAQPTYNNAGVVKWQAVQDATSYTIDRKIGGETDFIFYKEISANELIEKDLKVNTSYSYRVKAFSSLSESVEKGMAIFATPDYLPTPQMTASNITHESLKLSWVANSLSKRFVISRKLKDESEFKKLTEVQTNEYTDKGLKEITSYNYQIQAFSDLSESFIGSQEATTLMILANEDYLDFNLKITPNPAKENVSISLPDNFDGDVLFNDISGRLIFSERIRNKQTVSFNILGLKQGVYLIILKSHKGSSFGKLMVE